VRCGKGGRRREIGIELAREGVPLNIIQRQLGHQNLGVDLDLPARHRPGEIIETIHARRPPTIRQRWTRSAALTSSRFAGALPHQRHDLLSR
jgi:hypothetical protein